MLINLNIIQTQTVYVLQNGFLCMTFLCGEFAFYMRGILLTKFLSFCRRTISQLGVVSRAWNSGTQKPETEGSQILCQPRLQSYLKATLRYNVSP